jgi:hypothetical protein
VALSAAKALGRVGTVAAVAALREAMQAGGNLPSSAGRQAIAEIQARLKGAEPGQLSLAGGEAGALSLAGGEPGRLSLAEGQDDETADVQAVFEGLTTGEGGGEGPPREREKQRE